MGERRHGDSIAGGEPPADDPYLARVYASMTEYMALQAIYCNCDALCTCGWDELPEPSE